MVNVFSKRLAADALKPDVHQKKYSVLDFYQTGKYVAKQLNNIREQTENEILTLPNMGKEELDTLLKRYNSTLSELSRLHKLTQQYESDPHVDGREFRYPSPNIRGIINMKSYINKIVLCINRYLNGSIDELKFKNELADARSRAARGCIPKPATNKFIHNEQGVGSLNYPL